MVSWGGVHTLGRVAPQRPRRRWGRGTCSLSRLHPRRVTHRGERSDRGEQTPTGAGRRGRQVRQVRSAPPCAHSSLSFGELASIYRPGEHLAAVFCTLARPTPQPAGGLQSAHSLRRPPESPGRLAPPCSARAQHGAPPGPRTRAPARCGDGGGRGSER